MKVTWTKRWAALWVLWIAEFLVLEVVGLGCEHFDVPGCSTASSFMVSNLGVGLMIVLTLAVAAVLCWHWMVVDKDNSRRAQWLQEHRHELRFGWRKDKTLGTMLLSLDDFYTAWERLTSRLKPVAWKLDYDFTQYRGSCLGHGWAEWGRALPVRDPWTNADAEHIYDLCKEIDGYPNEEGTDNESAVKVMKKLGRLKSAAWTASEATLRTHLQETPCVFGATWTEGMCTTDRNGFIHPTGADVGGHDTCILEYHPGLRPYYVGANSWPSMHRFKIYASDMAKVLKRGEIVAALELPLCGQSAEYRIQSHGFAMSIHYGARPNPRPSPAREGARITPLLAGEGPGERSLSDRPNPRPLLPFAPLKGSTTCEGRGGNYPPLLAGEGMGERSIRGQVGVGADRDARGLREENHQIDG